MRFCCSWQLYTYVTQGGSLREPQYTMHMVQGGSLREPKYKTHMAHGGSLKERQDTVHVTEGGSLTEPQDTLDTIQVLGIPVHHTYDTGRFPPSAQCMGHREVLSGNPSTCT